MAVSVAFALVIMMHGWINGNFPTGALGNAIDHIPGFTSEDKCNKAAAAVKQAGPPEIIRTVCVSSPEPVPDPPDPVYVLVSMLSGWDTQGSGARGNALDFIPGYSSADTCNKVAEQIKGASGNKEIIRTVCIEQYLQSPIFR